MTSPQYICPICSSELQLTEKTFRCENNHCFDYAKEGYVHLLPVQNKKSLNPGDDKNMVMARRAFLENDFYHFLRERVIQQIDNTEDLRIVDLGCGEGYYTNELKIQRPQAQVYGTDISKAAVKYAAKRNKEVHYSVATNALLPFADNSIDVILNIFAPISPKECLRIIKQEGRLVTVTPGQDHLFELKQFIYDAPERHEQASTPDGFELKVFDTVSKLVRFERAEDLENLLLMTPFGWKITPEKKQHLLESLPLDLSFCFNLSEYNVKF